MKKTILFAAFAVISFGADAQNLIVNSGFDEVVDEQTYSDHPDHDGWFIYDWTDGVTYVEMAETGDEHGQALKIVGGEDNTWYRFYLGQRVSVEKAGTYVLSFDAKAVTDNARIRVFIRDGYDKNWFVLRKNFNAANPATKNISAVNYTGDCRSNKWRSFKFEFDLKYVVNYFNSIQAAEANNVVIEEEETSEKTLENLIVAIQIANKNESVLIDNVSFSKK